VVEPAHDLQVLPAGEFFLDGGRLPGEPDPAAHRVGVPHHVQALDLHPARVRLQQPGEDLHRGRLARPVRAEHAEHGSCGNGEIDPAQCVDLTE